MKRDKTDALWSRFIKQRGGMKAGRVLSAMVRYIIFGNGDPEGICYYYYDKETGKLSEGTIIWSIEQLKEEIELVNARGQFFIKLSPFTDAEVMLLRMTGCFTGPPF